MTMFDTQRESRKMQAYAYSKVAPRVMVIALDPTEVNNTDPSVDGQGLDLIPPWRTCIAMSVAFLLVNTAFEVVQNLQGNFNEEDNLRATSLTVLYGCVAIGSTLAPLAAKTFGAKTLIIFGLFVHICYIISNSRPVVIAIIPISMLLGLSIGGIGMSTGIYITSASKSYLYYNNLRAKDYYGVLSIFNGVLYSCFKASQILGYPIASLGLSSSSHNASQLVFGSCSASVCANDNTIPTLESSKSASAYMLFAIFIVTSTVSLLICLFGLSPITAFPSLRDSRGLTPSCGSRDVFYIKFLLLGPLVMAQSMSVMLMYTGYAKAFSSCTTGEPWVEFISTSVAVTAVVSSLLVSLVAQYERRPALFLTFALVDVAAMSAMLAWSPNDQTSKWLLFILPTMSGMAEGVLQPQFSALASDLFPDTVPQAFAVLHFLKGGAFFVSLVVSGMGCIYHQLLLTLALYVTGTAGYVIVEFVIVRGKRGQW